MWKFIYIPDIRDFSEVTSSLVASRFGTSAGHLVTARSEVEFGRRSVRQVRSLNAHVALSGICSGKR